MRAGRLRHRLEIQESGHTRSGAMDVVEDFDTVARRWGEITPVGGSEKLEAQQITAEATHLVRIRCYADLTVKHRFKFGTRTFDINHIANVDERDREQVCTCTERPSGS
jgi:SPP1 family predicted phage head-tail adaptor